MADQDYDSNASLLGDGPINTRAPQMWEFVGPSYDWYGKTVLDIGCGGGDMMYYAELEGAHAVGIDLDPGIAIERGLTAATDDLNEFMENTPGEWDVIFCFSVLPYVDMERTLANMAYKAPTSYVECQLYKDGPGTVFTQAAMRKILENHWPEVKLLGHTVIRGRGTTRDIWKCSTWT